MTTTKSLFSRSLEIKVIASGAIGNLLESSDVILVVLLSQILSSTYFSPSANPNTAYWNIINVFCTGLGGRLLGNFVLGTFADRYGRKRVMQLSLLCTGIGTTAIGLLPTYAQVGSFATILFYLFRIMQNIFVGTEYVSSASYLIENTKPKSRGFYGSWAGWGISAGNLFACLVVYVLLSLIDKGTIPSWSWRAAFLFMVVTSLFGSWIRYSVPESLGYILENTEIETKPFRKHIKDVLYYVKKERKKLFGLFLLTLLGSYATYIFYAFIPMQLVASGLFNTLDVLSLNLKSISIIVLLIPLYGYFSDRVNKYKLLKICSLLLGLFSIPFFWSLTNQTNLITYFSMLLAIPSAAIFSLYPVILAEIFPVNVRCTAASTAYMFFAIINMILFSYISPYFIMYTQLKFLAPTLLTLFCSISAFFGITILSRK